MADEAIDERQAPADLQASIGSGKGDTPLTHL
jgi:hypothetical protein